MSETTRSGLPSPFRSAAAIAAADLNGDGRPDLVVSDIADSNVSALLNFCQRQDD